MKRALIAIATGLLVATLVPITSNAADPLPRQTATSNCEPGKAKSVEVVLLVDQSTSLSEGDGLASIKDAVEQVGKRLDIPGQDERDLDVKFGAAKFGKTASTVQPLEPVELIDFDQLGAALSNKATLEGSTDYVAGLEEAIGLFDSGDPQACKVLLWFTDGTVDLEGVGNEEEAADLISAVCGDERPIARRIGSKGIVTFAVLLNTEEQVKEWNERDERFGAGLSSMQAIAGVNKIEGLTIADYQVDKDCERLIIENSKLGGEVLVGSGQLAGILSTRLCEALGCESVIECPETVRADEPRLFPEGGMPPGVMLSNVYVTAVAGEIGLVSAVSPDGTRKRLSLNREDNRLVEADLEELPGGWQLEISSGGQEDLEVCIQADEPEFPPCEVTVSTPLEFVELEELTPIELTVDWSSATFDGYDEVDARKGVIQSWEMSDDVLKVVGPPETFPITESVVDVTVASLGDVASDASNRVYVGSVNFKVTLQSWDEPEVCEGRIETPIQVSTSAERPQLTCENADQQDEQDEQDEQDKLTFGDLPTLASGEEVDSEKTYESTRICSIVPPKTGSVKVYFDGEADPDMPWQLQEVNGDPDPLQVKRNGNLQFEANGPTVEFRVVTSEFLENKKYNGKGSFKLHTEWIPPQADESGRNYALYDQAATFEYTVDLIARSNPRQAAKLTLIAAAIAVLMSLALLRLMNHLLVKIPEPGAFYFRAVPVKISPDPVLGATWSPTGDGFASESRPVGADSPGRDLKAGPLRVHRALSPVWKPFAPPFSRLKGDRVIRSTPSGRRAGTAPVAFPSLTALMASGDEQSTDGSFAGQIVVLYPRRHEFDETQVRQDVDRLVGPVGEDLGRLTPQSSDTTNDGPDESGGRPPGRPDPEPTPRGSGPRGSGPSAPQTRSGPQPGPAQDTTTSDREPPRREPPRREPPPRRS